jgi:L-ascorbate metabolism protein UlaG (beta-lactamase superfamily)
VTVVFLRFVEPGPPTGFGIKFTNGLTVYLSGDTGIHTEMKTVVNDFHKANLTVLNLGPNAMTPLSAAHAVNELIRPAAVIVTHVNEGATTDGKLKPNSRTAAFIKLTKLPVHLAISGRTMEFNGSAKCVTGCN